MSESFTLTPFFLDETMPGLERLLKPDWNLNKPALRGSDQLDRLVELYQPLRDRVANAVNDGKRPVSIAGDCCTSIPFLAGLHLAGLRPSLIWFDAHGDFNTWETTPSGFLGGMPLAMIVGRGMQTLLEGVGLQPMPESSITLCDARDLDPLEQLALAKSDIHHIKGADAFIQSTLPEGPVYVHFDTDFVDSSEAPAMNYPATGGPGVAKVRRIFRRLAKSGQLCALSISSWNPSLDENRATERLVLSLMQELLTR